MTDLPYLAGYPPQLQAQAEDLLARGVLAGQLAARYPATHQVHSSKALHRYVQELKAKHMRNSPPLAKVVFDDKLHVVRNALGLHITATQLHGSKTKKRREVRIAGLFKEAPADFLRMIVVHELAHMKHSNHDRDFYKLCTYMEPDYHQLELDVRLYLTAREWRAPDEASHTTPPKP